VVDLADVIAPFASEILTKALTMFNINTDAFAFFESEIQTLKDYKSSRPIMFKYDEATGLNPYLIGLYEV
jgi:hypothetical protein